ncbi:MAG TPA: CsgG/HfaB family protein [bacterium]|nr:CsgG/HfaB family protein [bacterium]
MVKKFLKESIILSLVFLMGCAQTGVRPYAEKYKGPKKRIAVIDFEVKVPRAHRKIGSGMAEMLITALHETGEFVVVERKAISDMIKEQDLGEAGRVRKETAAKIGDILGAQVLVRGAVTEFEEKVSRGGVGGVLLKKKTGAGLTTTSAYVACDIRMYDATTGVILEATTKEAKARSVGVVLAGVLGTGNILGGGFSTKTPLGKATRGCIDEIVNAIVDRMETVPWQASIVKVSDGNVYINVGTEAGVKKGEVFEVYRVGEELIDPETGLSLGAEESYAGKIKIGKADKKYAIATIMEGEGFQRGDVVRIP